MVQITVTVDSGVFLYEGSRPDGSAKWLFMREKNGQYKAAPVPRKWRSILKDVQEKAEELGK